MTAKMEEGFRKRATSQTTGLKKNEEKARQNGADRLAGNQRKGAMTAEREALKLSIEFLTVLFPTEVSSFDFQVESTDRTVQYKLNAQSLRLFGLHRDVNDAHRACANRLQNKQKKTT